MTETGIERHWREEAEREQSELMALYRNVSMQELAQMQGQQGQSDPQAMGRMLAALFGYKSA